MSGRLRATSGRRCWTRLAPGLALAGASSAGLVWTLLAQTACAAPKWNTGLELGACGRGQSGLERPGFCGAARGDILFGSDSGRGLRLGPALRLGTRRFEDLRLGLGASLLLPLSPSFPLVLEAGPELRNFREPGAYASLFVGVRTYNHYGDYEMAGGLSLAIERSFSSEARSALWLTARLDGSWLALPFFALYNGLK